MPCAYAQFGGGSPFPDNIVVKDDGTVIEGAGKIIDLRTGLSATYDSLTSTYHLAGAAGGSESTTVSDTSTVNLTLTGSDITADGLYTAGDFITLTGADFDVDTAAVTNGDITHLPTADGVYDFVTGLNYITAAGVPAAETDAAHDNCSEITGCVVGAITAAGVPAAETDAAHDTCAEVSGCVVGALTAEVDGSTTNEIEVVDEAYSAANFNGGTTTAVSQDDLYDLIHAGDADDDGKPDVVDTTSNGFVITSGGAGAISIDTATYQASDADLTDLADGSLTGTKVGFADTDSNFAATDVQSAIEELDNVNGSGVNAADGKVDWTQLVNVPAGFADGADATGAGGSSQWFTVSGVGIGTTDPVGIGTYNASGSLEIVKIGTQSPLMVSSVVSGDGDYLIVKSNGNVGLGTLIPPKKLYVTGDAQVTGTFTADLFSGSGGNYAEQVFTVGSGTYTPNAKLNVARVLVTGAGGGTPQCANTDSATGGGGAGGTAIKTYSASTIGSGQVYSVGIGTFNATGTNTTFGTGGTLITGVGGNVGIGTTWISGSYYANSGDGGVPTGGTINIKGGSGSYGQIQTTVVGMGGIGGSSLWGGGGRGGLADAQGNPGVAYGSGAGGCAAPSATDRNGAVGAGGIVYIQEFLKD